MIKQYKLRFYNFKLVILLTAISLFGVQLVASASPDLRNKQLLGVVMGLVLLVILSLMDYSWILNFQWIMYGFNLLMLIGVRLFGSEAGGASRWLDIGGFRFSLPSFPKLLLFCFLPSFLWIMKMISILSGCWQNQCSFWLFHWLLFMHNRI